MNKYTLRADCDWSEGSTHYIATPSALAKSMFYYVQEIGYFLSGPRYYTEREHLDSFLIAYTLSGRGYLKYGGKTYALKPGQLFFIHCEPYQYYETDRTDLWEAKWVHFNGAASRLYYDQFKKSSPPVLTLRENSHIPEWLDQLAALHNYKDLRIELLTSQVITDILTELLLLSMQMDRQTEHEFLPEYVRQSMDYMEKRYRENMTLDDLAERFAVSKYHLTREFKKYTGSTPHEFLLNMRITEAKHLLKHTDLQVNDIALQVGFEYVNYFITAFKKREKVTPLVFRKQWRHFLG